MARTSSAARATADRLLTVEEAGQALGTGPRFPRRLIAERRIRFVRIGRLVRIHESDLEAFIQEGTVDPIRTPWTH